MNYPILMGAHTKRRISIALFNNECNCTRPRGRFGCVLVAKLPSQLGAILVQFFEESSKKNHFC